MLGDERASAEPLELALYARDAGVAEGRALAVCWPRSTEELAAAVRVARRHRRPFVARGSGTGLAGGATPFDDPVVIVTTQMNRVLEVDPEQRVAWVEPGVLNLDLSRAVAHLGLHYAPDPSSQQACTIGGNVGTNAGGPHCLSEGVTSAHVLAVDAVLEMMDARITRAVEDYVGAGYPRDAEAVLLVELEGLPAGVAEQSDAVDRIARDRGAASVRVAADDAERALLWKGRKSAFGAIARIAPDYYLHDAVVPRTRLVDVLERVYAVAEEQRLTMMNVFHAGDGNLHPLIVFDAREPGIWPRVTDAGDAILAACVEAGGVLSGEHGIGLEKRDAMPLVFGPDDLDAQARLRDAFDPSGRANPDKVLPQGSRCGELSRVPAGAWI